MHFQAVSPEQSTKECLEELEAEGTRIEKFDNRLLGPTNLQFSRVGRSDRTAFGKWESFTNFGLIILFG